MKKKIYIIAGEASGDLHGANLIKNLRANTEAPLEIYGVGGDKIKETGALNFFDLAHFHVTGFTDAIKRIPDYKKAEQTVLQNIRQTKPDLVVLIDNPGFNLHIARFVHGMGIPIIYYIAPQIWAWAPKRILKIKKYVKKVIVVFEFEKKIYEEQGIPVTWVGHPLKDLVKSQSAGLNGNEKGSLPKEKPLVALLPGSRKGEIKMLLNTFVKAASLIKKSIPGCRFMLIQSPTLPDHVYKRFLGDPSLPIELTKENTYRTIRQSDLAIVCSGTATLECSLLQTPMIISNRGTFLTYAMAKVLIKVPYLGLPNLILGERKIPELLQYDAVPEKIAAQAVQLLQNTEAIERMKEALRKVSEKLGDTGATQRAANEILREINQNEELGIPNEKRKT